MYAQVVLGLPVEGPFDYFVPENLRGSLKTGMRVEIDFRFKKCTGYVVALSKETSIKKTKPVLNVLDGSVLLDKSMLSLTRELSEYYCCSWGEAIETALPENFRKIKALPELGTEPRRKSGAEEPVQKNTPAKHLLIHDMRGGKWDSYIEQIKQTLSENKQAIVLLADKNLIPWAQNLIAEKTGCNPACLHRNMPGEIESWKKINAGLADAVIGTRSAVFAPAKRLGLIIIDDEHDTVYKQDQVPHYHAREVAFMRAKLEGAKVVLGSSSPSLESFHAAKENKTGYLLLKREAGFPEIKTFNALNLFFSKKNPILSKYLQDAIAGVLERGGKTLLFLNRKGFATFASCQTCGVILKCPRCNINLIYHFKEAVLSCHYCSFKMKPPQICPTCNSGYIKYSGFGTEKIESELSRIFPQARLKQIEDSRDIIEAEADIFISTQAVIKHTGLNFDLIGVLSIDNSLNRVDFRASERAFEVLAGLIGLTDKVLIIQTALSNHHAFKALEAKDVNMFYDEELRQRKQLDFPPFSHLGLVKLRGQKEEKVNEVSARLFEELNKNNPKGIQIIALNPGQPPKLRGNYYRQILLNCANPKALSKFLKSSLKNFSYSGIIITVDIDPL
ncbi:MAG: primosomal protein N' [Candidatus Omnitrophica bacterium]|nr:primosomal protein N' [Candidatus Omnitrophota bacterium]